MILLVPFEQGSAKLFNRMSVSKRRHETWLARMQELRGHVYLQDGAIDSKELMSGRHRLETDQDSWHLLLADHKHNVQGCIRYRPYSEDVEFSDLGVAHSELAKTSRWGERLKLAVQGQLGLARRMGVSFVEVGGWALAPEVRGSAESVRMALAMFALSRILGGAIGLSTATRRNCSASIIRRIGGSPLGTDRFQVPSYYDHKYGCEMEILQFHSSEANPRYEPWIEHLQMQLEDLEVICDERPPSPLAVLQRERASYGVRELAVPEPALS